MREAEFTAVALESLEWLGADVDDEVFGLVEGYVNYGRPRPRRNSAMRHSSGGGEVHAES